MTKRSVSPIRPSLIFVLLSALLSGCGGGSGGNGGGGGGGGNPPLAPTGVTAIAGNAQIALNWNASAGASSYKVSRATASGGPYSSVGTSNIASYTDTAVANGIAYYYVVSASNSHGASANSAQVSATPVAGTTSVAVSIDVFTNRHLISPYVYGGAGSKDAAHITDSGISLVRWGGNAASDYNWQLGTYNSAADYYFEDFGLSPPLNNPADRDSTQYIKDVQAAGSKALTTLAMMDWVAQAQRWSFPASTWPSQCGFDPYNSNAGDGLQADCKTPVTTTAQTGAYYPLLDGPPQAGDPANSVYRDQWASALASAFGSSGSCPIPYTSLTSCHFYDLDNEIDIWNGTHRDIHPNPSGYEELRDVYLKEANNLKGWDSAAVRLDPVSCCWWFYWNGANGNDKGTHGGVDFLPWWLNEVYWRDQIGGARSLDLFDIHAYPDGPDTSGWTTAQKQAIATRVYRDYWDPTYTTESWINGNASVTSIEPVPYNPFRIPRFRAIVNSAYPGTAMAITEWSAGFAGESDFSTALGDADAYGILGRERVSIATRWGAPDPANPNYQALKLYANYDSAGHSFNRMSVSATHNADSNLFSVFAATNASGNSMTVMVLNKDPNNAAQTSFTWNGFTPAQVTTYTLSQASPAAIVAGSSQAWSSTMTFQPYTATLLVIREALQVFLLLSGT
jgi:Glycoside hydrolase family 44